MTKFFMRFFLALSAAAGGNRYIYRTRFSHCRFDIHISTGLQAGYAIHNVSEQKQGDNAEHHGQKHCQPQAPACLIHHQSAPAAYTKHSSNTANGKYMQRTEIVRRHIHIRMPSPSKSRSVSTPSPMPNSMRSVCINRTSVDGIAINAKICSVRSKPFHQSIISLSLFLQSYSVSSSSSF